MVIYSCEKCGKTFKQKGHYTNHINKKNPCDNIKDKIENIVIKIENYDNEINNFIQVCPKEMLDKLENPITLKSTIGFAS